MSCSEKTKSSWLAGTLLVPTHLARIKELDTISITGNNLSLLELELFIVGTWRARWERQCLTFGGVLVRVTSVEVKLVE